MPGWNPKCPPALRANAADFRCMPQSEACGARETSVLWRRPPESRMKSVPLRLRLAVVAAGVGSTLSIAQNRDEKTSGASAAAEPVAPPTEVARASAAIAATPAPVLVDSIAALRTNIGKSMPGETIVLKNGTYTVDAAINVTCVGTAEQPITITAESVGGAEIAGVHGFKVNAPAAHVIISGFKFTHTSGKTGIAEGTHHVRFTRNLFVCAGDGHYFSIAGDDAQIDFNEFGPKKDPGTMIAVSGTGTQVARRLWIHHNYFHDFDNDGSNGAEMVRIGLLSSHRLSKGMALVEHNLFVRCRRVNDFISNRSSANTYRYNTFVDSPSSHFTVRQGDDCVIYGNIFRNTEGVRLYGDRHQVFSNYFEGNYIGIAIGNGTAEISELGNEAPPNSNDRPDGCVIAFNTFVDNNTHYQMSRRTGGLGATKTTFANNILQGGAVAAKIDGPNPGAVWTGNLLWKTKSARDLPADGHTVADPLLAADPDGIKRPAPGSPAIAGAAGDFPAVTFDLDGQPRAEKKTIGADEPATAAASARILTSADVGPLAAVLPDTQPPTSAPPRP